RLAIAEKPDYTFAHRCLTLVRKYTADDPHLAQMEALNNAPDATRETRAQLGFALAKAYEDVGDYKRSFDALAQGNAARQDEIGYDATLEKNRFGTLTTLFRDYELSPIEFKPIPYRPIFVVGMPRSGTSLCEQILSRHHAVWGAGELEDLRRAVIRAAEGNNRRLSQAMIRQVRSIYLSALSDIDAPHGVITDKMPGNFRFVGFMRLAFPEAKIIHMRRDPMAVCWSLFKSYFAVDGHGYAYNLADAADYYKLYCDLMAVYEGLWPDTLCSINYEALTEDPETHIRTLLDACDLPFDPACLESHRSTRAVRTVSALQVRSAIYKGSSEAWRKFEPHLDPLMDRLADHGLGPKAPSPTGAPASHDSAEVRAVSPPSAG
ncbi:MAG: sulfotransferase, partial [Pseudomonadota bacterium]